LFTSRICGGSVCSFCSEDCLKGMFNFTDESSMLVDRLLKPELGKNDGGDTKVDDEGDGKVEGVGGGEDGGDNGDCRCEFGCDPVGGRGYWLKAKELNV